MEKLITNKSINDISKNSGKKSNLSFKFNKKLIIVLIMILVIVTGIKIANILLANQGLEEEKYTVLKAGSSISKINVKGEVKSENTTKVYSNLTLPIKQINVEVGDRVKAGDVLATLDTTELENKISELEATIYTTDASNKISLENARLAYDNALKLSSDENNEDIKSATSSLNAAKLDYENKQGQYEKYTQLHKIDAISDQELKEYKISYENAKDTYDKCLVALNNVKCKVQLDLDTAKNNYDAAKVKYEDKSQLVSLENLKNNLNNAAIKSTIDGIISAKNVSEGSSSSGTSLFEIEDENNINATVNIKEVDIEKVKEGQEAQIKTDSTGIDIIHGQVISVKPIAKAEDTNAFELNDDSDDKEAKYEVKIKITDQDYKLKIGMKVKADIILDEEYGVYTVSSESIIKDKDDNDCLYIAEKEGNYYVVEQIPITKGTDTDVNVEVSGEDIKDDVIVLNSPSDYEIGNTIKIKGK